MAPNDTDATTVEGALVRIRAIRYARRPTFRAMAKASGLSRNTIRKILLGDDVFPSSVFRLLAALCPIDATTKINKSSLTAEALQIAHAYASLPPAGQAAVRAVIEHYAWARSPWSA